jgi:hypothetical protein
MGDTDMNLSATYPLEAGVPYPAWCTTCQSKTPHVWGWFRGHWVTCLKCNPEAEAIIKEEHAH